VFGRIKKSIQSSRRRAEILAEAREVLAELAAGAGRGEMADRENFWAEQARKPLWEVQEKVMRLGLAALQIQQCAQEIELEGQRTKENIWAPVSQASRN
jgi:hypothetical protein